MKNNKLNKINRGFTLIELLVVISIISLLSSVILSSLNSARSKSRDAKRVLEIRQLKTALELYYDKNGSYPTEYDWASDCNGDTALASSLSVLITEGFIKKIPTDPKTPSPWPQCYYYQSNNSCNVGDPIHPYILIFQAENTLRGYTSWNNETDRYCTYP